MLSSKSKKRKSVLLKKLKQKDRIINVKMSKKQRSFYNKLEKQDASIATEYALTFIDKEVINRDLMFSLRKDRALEKVRNDKLDERPNNYYLKMMKQIRDPKVQHSPMEVNKGGWVGVEIECYIPGDMLPSHSCDCECESYLCEELERSAQDALATLLQKKGVNRVTVKHDGSITQPNGDTHFAVEITLLFQQKDKTPLVKLCEVLKELKAEVNSSCGLHVHLDQRDITNMAGLMMRKRRLAACLPLMASMMPASRRKNDYCALRASNLDGDRYTAINMTAYESYKTIEIRLHSGTTNFTKINNWIDFLFLISRTKWTPTRTRIKTIDDLTEKIDVPEMLIEYIENRVEKFNKKETEEQESEAA